ncbi:high-affinity branched-chain amino acid ABC transporter permease LivM [Burkholderia sp. Ac-20353]|uniref:high-affinity branched-chain amino acid ABC transporter permease LivM n=1 Tax=Burkholderia sp. Ac-20353 TaxID=2703894 RepID=UPI00197BCE00|nr:high-affinity branched-chain amino acid ABC transporter permease LivM [Burkholderia sp. Ac-20353]MBN3786298.1 high-affinity branched-chain amino acid ABC transporter permease LivM [Burkholderia sp. Ac-20353]
MSTTMSKQVNLPFRIRDALGAAIVAAVVGLPMLGLTTHDGSGGLQVQTRWPLLGAFVIAAFVGRMALQCLLEYVAIVRKSRVQKGKQATASSSRLTWIGTCAVAFAVVLPVMFSGNRYVVDTATTVLIYVMLGWGLNVVVGLAGLLDLGYVAFYAVGAYSYGLLSTHFGLGFWEVLPIAGGLAAAFGMILGYPTLRLRGDYLAIVTLGFGEIIRLILINWGDVTGGPNGVSSIPKPTFFGLAMQASADGPTFSSLFGIEYSPQQRIVFLYYLILGMALLTNLFVSRLRRLPVGRAWEAIREDEIACKAMGLNVTNIKLSAFAIGAMLAGFAGVFFAARQGFISPESFTFSESATILAIVVLGGMGSQLGVVFAAAVLVVLPELGRDFSEYRMLLFGLAMVLIMIVRPGGLISHRRATITAPAEGK